ncbi:hypothetical protein HA48_04865 [Pantoea wallisii]|uniref:Uncharacterized protein n=1 Tax=Pantoea wallisii TaxID=1076551 RepID=A0A1X1DCL0_9GAMM|nr:hypothetical protein HA48_04865 [Pantoea wallisii]
MLSARSQVRIKTPLFCLCCRAAIHGDRPKHHDPQKKRASIATGPSKRNLFMILVIARVAGAGQFSRKVQNFASTIHLIWHKNFLSKDRK